MKINVRFSLLLFAIVYAISFGAHSGVCQYTLPNNPGDPIRQDTVVQDSVAKDSLSESDSLKSTSPEDLQKSDGLTIPKKQIVEESENEQPVNPVDVQKFADTWVRRLMLRGWLDNTHIGAYASYQLTSWHLGMGSYGPVEARVTVYYLGQTVFMGKDAEWFQVVFRSMDDQETIIEYDLTVAGSDKITDFFRVLYRVDHGDIRTGNFTLPEGAIDYDKTDLPRDLDEEVVRLYVGSFDTKLFVGSGTEGATVYAYRSTGLSPLELVVLGYGEKALTLTATGADAKPRMDVPPPPSR